MGMTDPRLPAPAGEPGGRPDWQIGAATVVGFVGLLYVIELVDVLTGHRMDMHGVRPLETDGLWGILTAPLLHANWGHLLANTGPLLVLGFLMTISGLTRFWLATAIVWLLGGLFTWLIGDIGGCPYATNHIGASGLVFGWLAYLIVFGWLVRRFWDIVAGLVVLLVYGTVLFGMIPVLRGCSAVSWQGHLSGAVAGVLAAYLLSRPERAARRAAPPVGLP